MTQADAIKPIRALARPKALAIASIAGLVTVGWLYLAVTLAGVSGGTSILEVLCQPMFGTSAFGMAQAMLVFAMWCAMALAMMLPTAAPMILDPPDRIILGGSAPDAANSATLITSLR